MAWGSRSRSGWPDDVDVIVGCTMLQVQEVFSLGVVVLEGRDKLMWMVRWT